MFEIDGILYAGSQADMIKIQKAEVTGRMMMLLTFSSGEKRVFDAEILKGEVFEPLKDDSVFRNFKLSTVLSHGIMRRSTALQNICMSIAILIVTQKLRSDISLRDVFF